MHSIRRTIRSVICAALVAGSAFLALSGDASAQTPESRFADVNGVKLQYLIAGKGDPVVLLHGYAETGHMWRPLFPGLVKNHTVIAPDLRGFGKSAAPDGGYTKKEMAQDIHALVKSLGYTKVKLVGHDIGLMVAYAYAAQYPSEVDRIVLMDAFLPGVGDWKNVWLLRDLWHFHFYGKTPLALVTGDFRRNVEQDFARSPRPELFQCFAVVISHDDVARPKPDPQPYQMAAAALGVAPENLLVVEDSPPGVLAAVEAGCRTLILPGYGMITADLAARAWRTVSHHDEVREIFDAHRA